MPARTIETATDPTSIAEPEESTGSVEPAAADDDTDIADYDNAVTGDAGHEATDPAEDGDAGRRDMIRRRFSRPRLIGFAILPALALVLAGGTGYLAWQDRAFTQSQTAATQSVPAATEATIAMLSYHANTAEQELTAAREHLTGSFRDEYTKLITDLVIPGAKQKNITVTATIPAAASVSATKNHAEVLVYVNQTTTVGTDPPTDTASSVLVTLDKENGHWLVSKFDPV